MAGQGRPKATLAAARRAEREAEQLRQDEECWRLRRGGATYTEISGQLGISTSTAYERYERHSARNRLPPDEVREARELDLSRIERLFMGAFNTAMTGPSGGIGDTRIKATLACVKLLERRAKLLGLDAPVQVDAVVSVREQGPDELATWFRSVLERPIEVS